jgi:murein DD-endopeptidase MepM/ murein hydrolase activator NlpD
LRLWPKGAPWLAPGSLLYPVTQRWFATETSMSNEPVDAGDGFITSEKIYYHSGLDIGGTERMVDVLAATDGTIVSRGNAVHPGMEADTPVQVRYDVVYLRDARGWYHRYSHLASIDPAITVGQSVRQGQKIGVLGKEGASGGWSHLHYEIKARQPSGKWGTEDAYAYLWQAYLRQHRPDIVAVARPRSLVHVGEKLILDGSRSWSAAGGLRHRWTFSDGSRATGPRSERVYARAGHYSEILEVWDAAGHRAHDFAIVQVVDRNQPKVAPRLHATYSPSLDVRPGDPVTFKVRAFDTDRGEERWSFGDGTPAVATRSDGNIVELAPHGYAQIVHRFARAGHHLVRVERRRSDGVSAVVHLDVEVKP